MEENTKFNLKSWKIVLPYLKETRKLAFMVVFVMIFSAVSESVYPLFTNFAVKHFVSAGTTKGIGLFILAFAAAIFIGGTAVVIYCRNALELEIRLGCFMKRDCFVHLQRLSLSFFSNSSVGYLLARVMSDTDRISGIIAWGILNFLWNFIYIVSAFISMFILSPKLALILLLLIPIIALGTWYFQKKILVLNRKVRHINSQITGAYNEGITGAKASKTLVIEDQICREFSGFTADMYKHSIRVSTLTGILIPLITLIGSVAVAAVLGIGGKDVMFGNIEYATLSAFITYAVAIVNPLVEAAHMFSDLNTAQVCVERVSNLVNEECTITDTPEVIEKYGTSFDPKRENWEPVLGEIEFKNLWFRYPDSDEYVLKDFNLHIPAGTTVAIVGETGAGKSTLVNLACRFYEPTQGQVLIDGKDARERSQLWLHSALGYVLQDPHLFSGTLAENIRYGRLDATDEDVEKAAKLVSADMVASHLPEGYNTHVGEGGDRLSTGEKQLVSFARAVIADPPIFVLDEATSSIDTETELLIQNAISHILKGRTSFIIAHRLSTIRHADLILVVDHGKIVERGTHDELMEKSGRYAALVEAMRIKSDSELI